jgi:hypothetical protein
MSNKTIGLDELQCQLSDVLTIAEVINKIVETANDETIHEAQGIEDYDCPDFGGNMDDAYRCGVEDGMTMFARDLVALMNKGSNDGGA